MGVVYNKKNQTMQNNESEIYEYKTFKIVKINKMSARII